jgi:hypothetical protein
MEAELTAERFASLFVEYYIWYRGIPIAIVSDRDTRFTSKFCRHLTSVLRTKLQVSTPLYLQTDGLAEKSEWNRTDILKGICSGQFTGMGLLFGVSGIYLQCVET